MKKNLILTVLLSLFIGLSSIAQISQNGLIAHYPFHGNAYDESCNGNNGTVVGATLTTDRSGKINEAYSFNGATNKIKVYNIGTDLNPVNEISISVFIKPTQICGGSIAGNSRILRKAGASGYMLSWCQGNNKLELRLDGTNPLNISVDETPLVGNWHHIVATYSGITGIGKIYIDGNVAVTSTGNQYKMQHSDTTLFIGGFTGSMGEEEGFKGSIDDVRIYDRVLSVSEISALYNEGIVKCTITVTDTLVINENLTGFNPVTFQNKIKIYPNPTNDAITIDCGSNYSILNGYTIKITNSLSQTVYTSLINKQISTIDLNSWSGKGIYFIYLIDGNSNTVDIRKIILQ